MKDVGHHDLRDPRLLRYVALRYCHDTKPPTWYQAEYASSKPKAEPLTPLFKTRPRNVISTTTGICEFLTRTLPGISMESGYVPTH